MASWSFTESDQTSEKEDYEYEETYDDYEGEGGEG